MRRCAAAVSTLTLLRKLEACRRSSTWLGVRELSRATGIRPRALYAILAAFQVVPPVVRSRHKPRELREDGTLPRGGPAREYRLRTDWAGL